MEIDPTAPRSNDCDPNADTMHTSLDRPVDDAFSGQKPELAGDVGNAAPTESTEMQQPKREDHDTAQWSQPSAPAPPKSYLTQDLLSLFGLQQLAASVARTDPVTGEKINKMRKSYEGKVKGMGIAGKNKAINAQDTNVMPLLQMARWPEEEWFLQRAMGQPLSKGLSDSITSKLEKAMQMQPGRLPRNAYWEEQLGIEKSKSVSAGPDARVKPSKFATQSNGIMNGARPHAINTQVSASEVARPKRTAKKRRYDDAAFEGYGEGFVDDEADIIDAGGYSSGEGDRRASAAKKRKTSTKDFGALSPTIDRGGTYGPGIIGVGGNFGR